MAVRYECDDCGELIEQLRVVEHKAATAVTKEDQHDRCLSCLVAYLAELSERAQSLHFVNPTLEGYQHGGKFC